MAPPIFEIAPYLFTRRDTTSVLEHFGDTGPMDQTYFFSYLYTALPKGRAMLRHPRIQSKLKEFGFVVYGRAHRLPAGSKPVGQDDFEGKTARTEAPTRAPAGG